MYKIDKEIKTKLTEKATGRSTLLPSRLTASV